MTSSTHNTGSTETNNLIDDWKEIWIKQIDIIAREAQQDSDTIITQAELNSRLQETLNYSIVDDIDSETTITDFDNDNNNSFPIQPMRFIDDISGESRQQSDPSNASCSVGQSLIIKQRPSDSAKCFRDPAGVMAITDNQLAFVNLVWNNENVRQMKMHVVSNIASKSGPVRNERVLDFPYDGEGVRVVDMEYWPTHDRYVLAVVQTGEQHASWHYLFNAQPNEGEEAFERWVNCSPGDIVSRVCCTATTVYEIVNHFRSGFVLLLNTYGVTRARKSARELFPLDLSLGRYSHETLRLIDICCAPSNKQLAVAYNCALGSQSGPVGIHIFDPTTNWILLGRIDLRSTNVEFYMPRLMYLNKVNLFVALHIRNGNLLFYNDRGERVGRRPFIGYAEEYEDDQPHLYPVNICASQDLVAVRFSRWITVHRIND